MGTRLQAASGFLFGVLALRAGLRQANIQRGTADRAMDGKNDQGVQTV